MAKKPLTADEVSSACFDWKEVSDGAVDEVISGINGLLKSKNIKIHMYEDPVTEGSDAYGFIFSLRKLTKKEVREAAKLIWGPEVFGENENE
jgi:hypothetical protein